MERKQKEVTFCYHGGCVDGFFSAALFGLFEHACQSQGEDLSEQIMINLTKEGEFNLNIIENEIIEKEREKDFVGKKDNVSTSSYISSVNWVAYHHGSADKAIGILKRIKERQRKILLIVDVSNYDLAIEMSEYYQTVIFVDHHQTFKNDLDSNLETEDFPNNLSIVFNEKYCASFILDYLLSGIEPDLMALTYSSKMKQNLDVLRTWINQNDTMDLSKRDLEAREFIEAIYSLNVIREFNQGVIEKVISRFFSLDPDTYIKVGKPKLKAQMREMKEELKKVKMGEFNYTDPNGDKKNIKCLFIVSEFRNRSTLGYYMALESKELGLAPMAVVAVKKSWYARNPSGRGRKKEVKYLVSLRSLDDEDTIDVEEIAVSFGGGGHKRASGFSKGNLKFIKVTKL